MQTVAAEAGARVLPVTAASVTGAFFGESERRLREAFAQAHASASADAPAVLFLDEVDTLCPKRAHASGHSARVVAQLLALLDSHAAHSRHVRCVQLEMPDSHREGRDLQPSRSLTLCSGTGFAWSRGEEDDGS